MVLSTYLVGLLIISVNLLEQCLEHVKYSINYSHFYSKQMATNEDRFSELWLFQMAGLGLVQVLLWQ